MSSLNRVLIHWLSLLALLSAFLPMTTASISPVVPDGLHPMPPTPQMIEYLRQQGRHPPGTQTRLARGIDQPSGPVTAPSGPFRILAVAVQFSDKPGTVTPSFFDNLIFGPPPAAVSVTDYYYDVSHNSLTLVTLNAPSSFGWVNAPWTYNGPGGYVNPDGVAGTADDYGWGTFPQNLQGIVHQIVQAIDPLVDFSQYDNDNDGFVDGITFIHAGPGAEITGSPNDIWSSAWDLTANHGPGPLATNDGVSVDAFAFDPEYMVTVSAATSDQTIGTYCHEMGHLFGLPDLYDPDNSSYGLGYWSLMALGGWNGPLIWNPWIGAWIPNGASPAWLDAWSRTVLGFEIPIVVNQPIISFPLNPVELGGSNNVFRFWSPRLGVDEYFLIENRQQVGYDAYLPGRGLLVWHVDESRWNRWELNRYECASTPCCQCPTWHTLVALEQADGLRDLENHVNAGDAGDPFPGSSNNHNFGFGTTPESGSWTANPCPTDSCVAVNNISVFVPGPPDILMADMFSVCAGPVGCLDLWPDSQIAWERPGSSTIRRFRLENCGALDLVNVTAVYNPIWPVTLWNLSNGQPLQNPILMQSRAFIEIGVSVMPWPTEPPGSTQVLTLTATSGNNPAVSTSSVLVTGVPYPVLVVDDDHSAPDVESVYTTALADNHIGFDVWDVDALGRVTANALNYHRAVVWFTGQHRVDTLTIQDERNLAAYLRQGGQLFLSSQDYLYDAGRNSFNRLYLHTIEYRDDFGTNLVRGAAGNPVGQYLMHDYPLSPAAPYSDEFLPNPPAQTAFLSFANMPNGVTHDNGTFRLLFVGWPFENLARADAQAVMAATMRWFGIYNRVYLPVILRNR